MKKLTALLLTVITIVFAVSMLTAQSPVNADSAATVYTASNAHGITRTATVTDVHDAKFPRWLVTGEFPVMCFDPLLTSTVILDPSLCQGVNSQPVAQKRVERTVEPSTPIVESTEKTATVDESTESTESTDTDNPVVTDDKPTDDKPEKPAKVHCNNGEGNGGEGCSPAKSPNANNDENNTTPKEDKSNKPDKPTK